MFKYKSNEGNLFKGVFLAWFILLFHVALLALLGVLVLFFSGLLNYLPWIVLGGLVLLAGSGYLFLRFIARKSGSLVKLLELPELRGKNIEVNVLGGLASVKIKSSENKELTRLEGLLEDDLITPDEYDQAKQRLLGGR